MKWFKRLLITLVVLVTLAAFGVVFENWRAKRDWLAYKAEWEAKGERFDRAAFLPPDVPDDQNIAATPLLAPLRDFQPEPDPMSPNGLQLPEAVSDGVVRVYDWLRLVDRQGGGYLAGESAKLTLVEPPSARVDTNLMARYGLAPPPGDPEPPVTRGVREADPASRGASVKGPSREEIEAILSNPDRSVAANVLAVFGRFSTELDELTEATKRPHSVLSSEQQVDPAPSLLPKLAVVKGVANAFCVRALARLMEKDEAGALSDVSAALRLGKAMRSERLLITGLVRVAVLSMALQPVWEGLARHEWSDEQLRELDSMLGAINFVSDAADCLRAERSYSIYILDLMLRSSSESGRLELQFARPGLGWMPRAVIYRNELAIARMYQEELLSWLDPDKQVVDIAAARAQRDPGMKTLSRPAPLLAAPYRVFADAMMPAVARAVEKFTLTQGYLVMARVACALERHRLANGDYPTDLEALVPDYLPALPVDPAGGGPLYYRRLSADNFLLYSAGPNGRDNGGKIVRRDSPNRAADPLNEESDWVWTYPSRE